MSAYRQRPPGALDLAPPDPDAAWYEHLAHQVVLAHQPAPARTLPGPSDLDIVRLGAKYARPHCRRCRRDVDRLDVIASAFEPAVELRIVCHGETTMRTITKRGLRLALAQGFEQLGRFLVDELRAKVFEAAPLEQHCCDKHASGGSGPCGFMKGGGS